MRKPQTLNKLSEKPLRDTLIFAERNWLKYKNNPYRFFDIISRPILFLVVFSLLLGKIVAGSVADYQELITPGMILFTALTAASTVGASLGSDVESSIFNRFRTLPTAPIAPMSGALLADVPQYVLSNTAVALAGVLLGWRPAGGFAGIALALLLATFFAWCVSWICAFTSLANNSLSRMISLVLMALIFLSNAFVPVSALPGFIGKIASINPVTHWISAITALSNGSSLQTSEIGISIGFSAVILLLFIPLTVHAFSKAESGE